MADTNTPAYYDNQRKRLIENAPKMNGEVKEQDPEIFKR
jgi:hypothetical protein